VEGPPRREYFARSTARPDEELPVTEQQWAACAQTGDLLAFLRGRASPRKFRLFAAACCRRLWGRCHDPRTRHLIEVAERYADGAAPADELLAAVKANDETDPVPLRWAAANAAAAGDADGASRVAFWASYALARDGLGHATYQGESAAQCRLARDIFGNPFRPVSADAAWLKWNGGLIGRLAQGMYEGGRFVEVPVLGLALEQASCDVPEVLDHCREQEGHVKGCWVVDLLTGKL
jgi:hypothetical protein